MCFFGTEYTGGSELKDGVSVVPNKAIGLTVMGLESQLEMGTASAAPLSFNPLLYVSKPQDNHAR